MLSMQLVRSGLVKMYLHFQFQRRWYRGFFPFPDTRDSSSVQTQYNALKSDLIFLIFKSLLKMYKPWNQTDQLPSKNHSITNFDLKQKY